MILSYIPMLTIGKLTVCADQFDWMMIVALFPPKRLPYGRRPAPRCSHLFWLSFGQWRRTFCRESEGGNLKHALSREIKVGRG